MEIRIIEDKKNLLVFDIVGVTHGFCTLLKDALLEDKNVKLATYKVDHPLVGIPRLRVEGSDPNASVKKALKAMRKQVEDFEKEAKKIK